MGSSVCAEPLNSGQGRVCPRTLRRQLDDLQAGRATPRRTACSDLLPFDLTHGRLHEWLGVQGDAASSRQWSPPLELLIELARRSMMQQGVGRVVWVGRSVHPYAVVLGQRGLEACTLLARSLFVHAQHASERLWAADLSLRSRVAAVIADGRAFDLRATRRLQLAAEAGGSMCLLARPPWEAGVLSAAATRWMVSFLRSPTMTRRWSVELLRCKGMQPDDRARRARVLELDRATRALRVAPDVLDGLGETATRPPRRARTG
ncbi:MAG TPA: hypothetical protein VD971_09935 [Phycisphaerales bacterium]|nr:hypothetical protein [Phycisphaerales bacterium]